MIQDLNNAAFNGVLHVVDTILYPAFGDIMATSFQAPDLTMFGDLMKQAGLEKMLKSEGNIVTPVIFFLTNFICTISRLKSRFKSDWFSD